MAKAILICGKLCSGKTTYCNKLISERGGVLLSCDEITLQMFDGELGEKHDDMVERIKRYLLKKASEIIANGVDVLLDWGFWQKSDRETAREFFVLHGIESELHYLEVSNELWRLRIEKRNQVVKRGEVSAYYVDEGLMNKFEGIFEAPELSEINVLVKCTENIMG